MDASDNARQQVIRLAGEFAAMRGRTVTEVVVAVLSSRTLANLGYRGGGEITQRQAKAAIKILENWIRRANELH